MASFLVKLKVFCFSEKPKAIVHESVCCRCCSERYMIALSQHCLPKDPEKINQCFAVFTVSLKQGVCVV